MLILQSITYVACFDAKDFDTDRLYTPGPPVHLPLVSDTMKMVMKNVVYDEVTGDAYFKIDMLDNINLPVKDYLPSIIGDTTYVFQNEISSQKTVRYSVANGMIRIDSMMFESGILIINIEQSGGALYDECTVRIPSLFREAGIPFEVLIPGENMLPGSGVPFVQDISGYRFLFKENTMFDVEFTYRAQIPESAPTFNADVQFAYAQWKRLYGNFGKHTVVHNPETVAINVFDEYAGYLTQAAVQFKEAFFDLEVQNSAGFPMLLNIDEFSTSVHHQVENVGNLQIATNTPQEKYITSQGKIANENIASGFHTPFPDSFTFTLSSAMNPNANQAQRNFITETSGATFTKAEMKIPLYFKATDVVIMDTLNFSVKEKPEDYELLFNIKNNIPMDAVLEVWLMDSQNALIPNSLVFKPLTIPAAHVDTETGRVLEADNSIRHLAFPMNEETMTQAQKLLIILTMKNNNYVRMNKDSYVVLNIGTKSKLNLNDFEDDE